LERSQDEPADDPEKCQQDHDCQKDDSVAVQLHDSRIALLELNDEVFELVRISVDDWFESEAVQGEQDQERQQNQECSQQRQQREKTK
jgi:hypothetical protein